MSRAKAFALGRRGGMTEYSRGIPAVVVTDNPRCSNQSLCFGLKRRSDRTHASIRGPYGNRGCAAPEICDDGKPVRSIPTMPPAVRFLSSGERNRRKKAAKGDLRRRKSRRHRFPGKRKSRENSQVLDCSSSSPRSSRLRGDHEQDRRFPPLDPPSEGRGTGALHSRKRVEICEVNRPNAGVFSLSFSRLS